MASWRVERTSREWGTLALREQGLERTLMRVGRLSALAVESFGARLLLFVQRADLVERLRQSDATPG